MRVFPRRRRWYRDLWRAWPLSEDYYLCVYDANTRQTIPNGPVPLRQRQLRHLPDRRVRQSRIHLSRSRDQLPSAHSAASAAEAACGGGEFKHLAGVPAAEATVIVNDVYDSLQPWPADTKITALRVWQILPLSVAPAARNNGIQVPGTGSINTGRAVLGTVPVESDGVRSSWSRLARKCSSRPSTSKGSPCSPCVRARISSQAKRASAWAATSRSSGRRHRTDRIAGDTTASLAFAARRRRHEPVQLCPAGAARAEQALHGLPREERGESPPLGRRADA